MFVVFYVPKGHYMDPDFYSPEEFIKVYTETEAMELVEDLTRSGHVGVGYESV